MPEPSTIWNPFRGCRKHYPGCENCWMFFLAEKHGIDPTEIAKSKGAWNLPLAKKKDGTYKVPGGSILNVCLTGDFFLEDVPDEWRDEVWAIIRRRSDVGFVMLTKRAHRIRECLPDDWGEEGYPNVELAVTVENQQAADERIPYLLGVSARKKRIMCEPLIGPVDLSEYLATGDIDEVLCGGENYDGARTCRLSWARELSEQCVDFGVAFDFFDTGSAFFDGVSMYRISDAEERKRRAKALRLDVEGDGRRELVLEPHPLDDVFGGEVLF